MMEGRKEGKNEGSGGGRRRERGRGGRGGEYKEETSDAGRKNKMKR